MSLPSSPPPIPGVVGRLAADRPVRAVWVNEECGVTFRVGSAARGFPGTEFIKVANANTADFAGEAERLRWAARYVTVPQVLGFGIDEHCAWLRTRGLPGLLTVDPRWLAARDGAVQRSVWVCACCTTDCRCGHARLAGRRTAGWPN